MAQESKVMKFRGKFESIGPGRAWTCMHIPFDVEKEFGSRARVSVKGSFNGFHFRSSIFPDGKGGHTMMINKAMQQGAGARPGETVAVVMQPDTAPRTVKLPADLKKALARSAKARAVFEKLAPSYKKDYVTWIESAKRAETRAARVAESIPMLEAGKKALS